MREFQVVIFAAVLVLFFITLCYHLLRGLLREMLREIFNFIDRREFRQACLEFQAAFVDELIRLERPYQSTAADRPFAIIRDAMPKHRKAMLKFRVYLSESRRVQFDRAWKNYEGEDKYEGTYETLKFKRQLAIRNIRKLLEFGEEPFESASR